MAVRGASPGTRASAELGPTGKLTVCHAVVLAGSSAYGLAAADGVVTWLEEQGVGYPVQVGVVPIVGAAIVLDMGVADASERPGPAAGRAAAEAATETDPAEGRVGAGTGCLVAKTGGIDASQAGGQGVSVRTHDDLVVSALVVNNAVGEIVGDDGLVLVGSTAPVGAPRYPFVSEALLGGDGGRQPGGGPTQNTVIGCVTTNAVLDKRDAHRVADLAHGGIVQAVRPAHTIFDGDAMFCLATGKVEAPVDLVIHLAVEAVAEAARRGPLAARSGG